MVSKRRPGVVGSAEIRHRLGDISRQRVYQITQGRSFPEPLAKLEMGNVWLTEEVDEWIAAHRDDFAD